MVHSKNMFLLYLVGFSFFCETQSSIFVVYPFKMGHINSSKPKFSSRKFDFGNENNSETANKTNLHVMYPVSEQIVTMTPMPMGKYSKMFLEKTTEIPAPYTEKPEELISQSFTTTDNPDTSTEFYTTATEETSSLDIDATTNYITSEIPIPRDISTGSTSLLPSDNDTHGPFKLLKKRMNEFTKYLKRYQTRKRINTIKNTSNIEVPSTTPKMKYTYRKRNKNKVTVVPVNGIFEETSSSSKSGVNKVTLNKTLIGSRNFNRLPKYKNNINQESL